MGVVRQRRADDCGGWLDLAMTSKTLPDGASRREGRFRTAIAVAVAICVGLMGILFRTAALSNYSPLSAGFEGAGDFRIRYFLENHRLMLEPVTTFSYWSDGVNTRLGSYLSEVYNAAILAVSGVTSQPTRLLHQLVLTLALISLAIILLNQRPGSLRIKDAALVAALATLGTPLVTYYLTGWNVAYGWVLLFAMTAVFMSGLSTRKKLLVTLMLALIGPPVYHSFGFLLVVYVVGLWAFGQLVDLKGHVISPVPVLVAYAAYQAYVSVQFFGELVTSLRDVLTLAFLDRDVGAVAVATASFMGIQLRDVHLALYVLLAIPIGIQVIRYARASMPRLRRRLPLEGGIPAERRRFFTATVALAVAVGVFALASGARFSGDQLVARGASYFIVPALVAIIAELRSRTGHYWYVYPLGIAVLALSSFAFLGQASTVYSSTQVTWAEAEGYQWLKQRMTPESVVWTDFRLSGPFIADGHLRVLGIHGESQEPTDELLNDIYYSSSSASIGPAIDRVKTYDGKSADYLFLSLLMTQDFPGLNGYGTHFPALPARFFVLLGASPEWRLIFENDEVRIYGRTSARSSDGS
jgi:hypothetical protein